MAELKNIILDLGGVLLNIDYDRTEKAFNELGFEQFKKMYSQYSADAVFAKLETGKISNDSFYEYMIQAADGVIKREDVTHAWNAMLLDFRITTLEFLRSLEKRYSLYLLSNTNAIHLDAFREIFTQQTGLASLEDYFTKAYYSHEVGLRKPNEDIFEFVLKDEGMQASQSLFIDDSYNNVATAKHMGFKTYLLLPGEKIEDLTCYT